MLAGAKKLEQLLETVQDDPASCARVAADALDADDGSVSVEQRVLALWLLGRARYEQGRVEDAEGLLSEALTVASREANEERSARIRNSLAAAQFAMGQTAEALTGLELAEPYLSGSELGRLLVQRGMIFMHSGRLREAVELLDEAHSLVSWDEDKLGEARLLTNRAIAEVQLGRLDDAEVGFRRTLEIARVLDQQLMVAGTIHNLGYLAGRRGDIPRALQRFSEARAAYTELDDPVRAIGNLDMDLCEVLLEANLVSEATGAAERAVAAASTSGNQVALTESQLLVARAFLANGDVAAAHESASEAADGFRLSERESWAALADYLDIVASLKDGTRVQIERVLEVADSLQHFGWEVEALHVRMLAVGMAAASGDTSLAASLGASAAGATRRGTAAQRAGAWRLRAQTALATGDRTGAKRALGAGLRVVEQHRASLGAAELQARASAHAADLVLDRLKLAVEDGSPTEILRWADRLRAASLETPAARPPDDLALQSALADLRAVHEEQRQLAASGDDVAKATKQVVKLEREIQALTRQGHGAGENRHAVLDVAELRAALGPRSLVEYFEIDGALAALIVDSRRVRLERLADLAEVEAALASTLFGLRRLLTTRAGAAGSEAAAELMSAATLNLRGLLIDPLGLELEAPVVLVPTGALFGVPWNTLAAAPLSIAPSAAMWLRLQSQELHPIEQVTLVAGPGLEGAEAEVVELARRLPSARSLSGGEASISTVSAALEDSQLTHLAAHGVFRADNPQFSSLELVDGPMTLYDIAALKAVPEIVVLPACDAGRADVMAGDELLGTAFALLQAGVRNVIAPIMPIPDSASVGLMLDLHDGLAESLTPAAALRRADDMGAGSEDPHRAGAVAAFLSIGV